MTTRALTDVINDVVGYGRDADDARKSAEALGEEAREHGWDGVAWSYDAARQVLQDAVTELGTLVPGLRATAPVLVRVSRDRSYPEVTDDLETIVARLDEARTALEGVAADVDDALDQARQVGAEHLADRLQNLLTALLETGQEVRELGETVEADLQAAVDRTGPADVPLDPPAAAGMQQLRRDGHGPQRHGPRVTQEQLQDRALKGFDPMTGTTTDGENGRTHKCGREATKFTSEEAFLKAYDAIMASPEFRTAKQQDEITGMGHLRAEIPLVSVFGPDYDQHVRGVRRNGTKAKPTGDPPGSAPPTWVDFTDGTVFAAFWQDTEGVYRLRTMYPRPKD